eukprot:TRINITY_DN31920_c0_g1_i1.p1 TRINITY_DN31920_c0_g1~~TRINITY_DN31920_c0_g1_i1.p1  ORF type:complete len:758 (+),score=242.30 TRINITY_DN31920_c0_g1_i1:75-2348(+)
MVVGRGCGVGAAVVVAAAACLWGYRGAIECDFVFDDDLAIVRNNDTYPAATTWASILVNDFWGAPLRAAGSNKSFRPVTVASFRLNRLLLDTPQSFHAVNVLLHVAATVLLCLYFYLLICRQVCAANAPKAYGSVLACGLLFALHPVHAEAVTGVVGRAEVLSCIFSLLGAIACIEREPSLWRCVVFFCCTITAALSKETGVMLVIVALLSDAAFHQRLCSGRKIALCIATGAFYTCLRTSVVGQVDLAGSGLLRRTENPTLFAPNATSQVLSLAFIQVQYAQLLVWPTDLCCEYPFDCIPLLTTLHDPRVLSILGAAAAAALVLWCVRRTGGVAVVGLVWVVVPYVPASGVILTIGTMLGERLLYMPSAGFCMLVAYAYFISKDCSPMRSAAALLVVCATWSETLHARNLEWRTNETLFESAVRVCPRAAKHQQQYALVQLNKHNTSGALHHLHKAREIDPDWCEPALYIGKALAAEGTQNYAEAHAWWKQCADCEYVGRQCFDYFYEVHKHYQQDGNATADHELGEVLLRLEEWHHAVAAFRQAGLARNALEDWEGAAESFEQAVAAWHRTGDTLDTAGEDTLNHPCNIWYWQAAAYLHMSRHRSALATYTLLLDSCGALPKSAMAAAEGASGILNDALRDSKVRYRIRMTEVGTVLELSRVMVSVARNTHVNLSPAERSNHLSRAWDMVLAIVNAAPERHEQCARLAAAVSALHPHPDTASDTTYCKLLRRRDTLCGDRQAYALWKSSCKRHFE